MTASVSRPISLKFCQEEWRGDRGRSLSNVEWSAEGQRDRGIKSPEMSLLGCRLQALPSLCLSALLLANLVGEEWGTCWRWDSLGGVPLGFITCVGSHVRHTHGRIHTHAYTHTHPHTGIEHRVFRCQANTLPQDVSFILFFGDSDSCSWGWL